MICFVSPFFDATFFVSCSSGGGSGRRRQIPIIDRRMHDDDLALVLLET